MHETSVEEKSITTERVSALDQTKDTETLACLIILLKISTLELQIEEFTGKIETNLKELKALQRVLNQIQASADEVDLEKNAELKQAIDTAKAMGLEWEGSGWKSAPEKAKLCESLRLFISDKESTNQVDLMRINRLTQFRTEMSQMMTRLMSDSDQTKRSIARHITIKN